MSPRRNLTSPLVDLFPEVCSSDVEARPLLKWAGGKTQLLPQFDEWFPRELRAGSVENYFEPFVGGGAVFFHVRQRFRVTNWYLSDINPELILVYQVVQRNVAELIQQLGKLSDAYLALAPSKREEYFYGIRSEYNRERMRLVGTNYSQIWIKRAAQAIFLNRTCYNGLFRVNKSGEFNVPFGKYKNPLILDEVNLRRVSGLLDTVEIAVRPFEAIVERVTENSFVYFDPPYRPLTKTSSFTSYSTFLFDDEAQRRLASVFLALAKRKATWVMLSNSDTGDDFFPQLYGKKGITIGKVHASRMINSKAEGRGRITELVITNYQK